MKIRKAKKEDFKEIAKILRKESSKKPYNEKYTSQKALNEIKRLSKNELYIAVDNKEIIGLIASSITVDDWKKAYINELWLKPKYQGQGIGKSLIKFIEDLYKKKKVKTIRLSAKRNSKAFEFYKKVKYKEYKEIVIMEKKLK